MRRLGDRCVGAVCWVFSEEHADTGAVVLSKFLLYFGIAMSTQQFAAGMATAIFGQVAVSLNDKPQSLGEVFKRLIGTMLCGTFAAMASGMPIVKEIPTVVLMGLAGAFSMCLIKLFDAVRKRGDKEVDNIADKIIDAAKDRIK